MTSWYFKSPAFSGWVPCNAATAAFILCHGLGPIRLGLGGD